MFSHDSDKQVVTQVPPSHILSICFLVLSQGVLWSQPGAAEQLLQRVRGERLLDVIDGPVIHSLRGQDPLDLAALASGRLFVNRHLCGRHFAPSAGAVVYVSFARHLTLSETHAGQCATPSGGVRAHQFLSVYEGVRDSRFSDLGESSQRECRYRDEEIANRNVEEGTHCDQV